MRGHLNLFFRQPLLKLTTTFASNNFLILLPNAYSIINDVIDDTTIAGTTNVIF